MAKKDTAEPFRIPSLVESDSNYAGLIAKREALNDRYRELSAERSKLRNAIETEKAAGGQRLPPEVAALLGDAPDSLTMLTQRQREIATEMSTIEAGQEVILGASMKPATSLASLFVALCCQSTGAALVRCVTLPKIWRLLAKIMMRSLTILNAKTCASIICDRFVRSFLAIGMMGRSAIF